MFEKEEYKMAWIGVPLIIAILTEIAFSTTLVASIFMRGGHPPFAIVPIGIGGGSFLFVFPSILLFLLIMRSKFKNASTEVKKFLKLAFFIIILFEISIPIGLALFIH